MKFLRVVGLAAIFVAGGTAMSSAICFKAGAAGHHRFRLNVLTEYDGEVNVTLRQNRRNSSTRSRIEVWVDGRKCEEQSEQGKTGNDVIVRTTGKCKVSEGSNAICVWKYDGPGVDTTEYEVCIGGGSAIRYSEDDNEDCP